MVFNKTDIVGNGTYYVGDSWQSYTYDAWNYYRSDLSLADLDCGLIYYSYNCLQLKADSTKKF